MLGGQERLSAGVYTQFAVHQRSVVAGDRLFHEEEQNTKLGDGTTASNVLREAFDGRWSRQYTQYLAPPQKPQTYASLDFESKDSLRPIRPHTLLFHDSRINSQLLSAYLASGWSDKLNGYSMTVDYVGDERIDGLHCHKLKCSEGQNGKSFAYWFVWLARDRNLLPLREEWREPNWSEILPTGISFVEDLREIRPGQWIPFRATDLAFQKDSLNGLNVGHILLQWRKEVVVDRATFDPRVGDGLFSSVEVPAGTLVRVQDEHGDSAGEFKQPRTGNFELSLEKLRAMQHAADTNEDDEYDPKDATTPQRKTRIDAAFKVLRSDPPARQDERIKAALTILRNYLIFPTNTKKWALAIHELIQIGKPAIPRLIRELDETDHRADRGRELRALGFVLRGIGDPRAVPALIRALPYTLQPPSSDCGCSVRDHELLEFMQEHDHDHTNGGKHFGFGRPINEVLPALQKLTGIKQVVPGEQGDQEYKDVYHIFRDGSAEEIRKEQRLFLQFADRWADWWSKNWKTYVKDEAEAQVEQTEKTLQRLSEVAPKPPQAPAPGATGSANPAKEAAESTTEALVVAPDGRPVANADVQAYDTSRNIKTYRTDQRGAFRIPGKWLNADSDMYFLVSRKGESLGWHWLGTFQNADVEKPAVREPLKITLLPCNRTIDGTCVDRAGRPMAKVSLHVALLENGSNNPACCPPYPECLGHGISNAEGHYSIKVPEYKICNIVAEHPDYVPVETSYRDDHPGPQQIVLKEPAGTVRGRVVDASTGSPIRGAWIFAQAIQSRVGYAGFRESVSDDNGQYCARQHGPRILERVL